MLAQDKVLGDVFFSLETRLYNRSIIFHHRRACKKMLVRSFHAVCGLAENSPSPEEESLAQMEERGAAELM